MDNLAPIDGVVINRLLSGGDDFVDAALIASSAEIIGFEIDLTARTLSFLAGGVRRSEKQYRQDDRNRPHIFLLTPYSDL